MSADRSSTTFAGLFWAPGAAPDPACLDTPPPEVGADGEGATPPAKRAVRSATVWDWARQDYADGFTAEAICNTYGLALSTFRTRARTDGWRRSDLTAAEPEGERLGEGGPDHPPPAPPTPDLVDLAWRQMAQALRAGEVYKARALIRLHAALRTEVGREETEVRMIPVRAQWAAADAARAKAATDDTDLHLLHPDCGVQNDDPEVVTKSILSSPGDRGRWPAGSERVDSVADGGVSPNLSVGFAATSPAQAEEEKKPQLPPTASPKTRRTFQRREARVAALRAETARCQVKADLEFAKAEALIAELTGPAETPR